MALLSIQVLGPFQVRLAGESVTGFATDKVRALLVYLALSPDRPHRREALAGLLWPEFPERSARSNLRNALANLRQVIGDSVASPPFLFSTRQTIQFNGQSDYWLDADAFEDLLTLLPATSLHYEQAVNLVRGPFLEGFSLTDAAAFEEWQLLHRERYGRLLVEALDGLAAIHEGHSAFELALAYARRRVELEPWEEAGQQQLMRLLIRCGRRAEALAQYEAHRLSLAEELAVEPAPETIRLYEQIRNGELEAAAVVPSEVRDLEPPARLPGFVEQETDAADHPIFVGRERELAFLDAHLDQVLAGHGHVVLITGNPGQGKTALLTEFSRRAMEVHPELLVASGNCNAYSGVGDPYLPFRDVMSMLTGEVQARWQVGAVSTTQARRLWNALPRAVHALLHHGPHVTGPLVAGQALLSRAALWSATAAGGPQSAAWLHRLRTRVEHRPADPEGTEQSHLFQQVTNVLRNLAGSHPLLLILDDLQWADTASIGLLFHLGRRLVGSCILIAGAYRAEEIALGRPLSGSEQVEQHPLEKVLSEFKRTHGDILLDLGETGEDERRRFVDALLETEPNRLGEGFRRELARRAGGNPLFTVELVRAMQARGDLERDSTGFWTEGPVLDWETLPLRVEGAIEARIAPLEPELREILSIASVEGEELTVQVVAQVQRREDGFVLRRLAQDLAKRHRLVTEQAEVQIGRRRMSRFRFCHSLVQSYFYGQLSPGERLLLHGQVASALERCYGEQADAFAVHLAHHHSRAGDDDRALYYLTRAAENAHRVYANEEAYTHYTGAMEAARRVSEGVEPLIRLYLGRGRVCLTLGDFEGALADYEAGLQLARRGGEDTIAPLQWRALVDMGRLWASRDYDRAHDCFREALDLAQQMGDPMALAESLNWMGNWHGNQEEPRAAVEHHQRALELCEGAGDRRGLATTLDLLGIASLLGGDLVASLGYYGRAVALFRELGNRPRLGSSLTGRGHARGATFTSLTAIAPDPPTSPQRDFEEAVSIGREIGSPAAEAWLAWSLGRMYTVQGRYGQALEVIQPGIEIATQIGHREWLVGNRCALGFLYLEMFAPEEARRELDLALTLAKELRSQYWIRWAAGTIAAACCLLDDLAQAQTYLESVLPAETPMDAEAMRYCWARRAELALHQGDPALALDIVERLIASAPGMAPERVITFLWWLKGEAQTAMGRAEEAKAHLQAAAENAQVKGERYLIWRMHAGLGQLYRAVDRQSKAQDAFSTARELLAELVGSGLDGELKDRFARRAHDWLRSLP